jgi:hypothetical protein
LFSSDLAAGNFTVVGILLKKIIKTALCEVLKTLMVLKRKKIILRELFDFIIFVKLAA